MTSMAPSAIAVQRSTKSSRVSLKHELADILNSCAPKDLDPEALDNGNDDDYDDDTSTHGSDMDSDMGAGDKGMEHYVAVGKSGLRAQIDEQAVSEALGRRYPGKMVKRGDLYVSDDEEKETIIEGEEQEKESQDQVLSKEVEKQNEKELQAERLPLEIMEVIVSESSSDEEIDSNYAFGESDKENENTKPELKGSEMTKGGVVPKTVPRNSSEEKNIDQRGAEDVDLSELGEGDDSSSVEEDDIYSAEEENEDQGSSSDEESDPGSDFISDSDAVRSELRKAMAADAAPTATYIPSAVASTDVEKGTAVRAQQAIFDGFLGGRMKIQPALIAANELVLIQEEGGVKDTNASDVSDIWKQAETAAVRLWNSIAEMRMDISPSPNPNSKKRKAPHITTDTPLPDLETHMTSLHNYIHPWRARTITKWTTQTHASSTSAADLLRPHPSKRLNNATYMSPTSTLSGLPSHLDSYLHPPGAPTQISPHLLSRAHIPRKCAPSHSSNGIPNSSEIYDDSDFYELLLRTFLDQRRANTDVFNAAQAVQVALKANRGTVKMRRDKDGVMVKVDVKASKGRRLRYTIHEKLQDFMAPVAEKKLGWWEERQIREFFGSLLGQKKVAEQGLDLDRDTDSDTARDFLIEENGLRVFG